MNTKLHAVTHANGRPISLFMTAGHVSDYTGASALLDSLPGLLGDRGCDVDWFRDALHPRSEIPDRAYPLRQSTSTDAETA
jgi:transposase